MFDIFKGQRGLTLFATILIIFYGIYYMPIDSFGTSAPIKTTLMVLSILVLLLYSFIVFIFTLKLNHFAKEIEELTVFNIHLLRQRHINHIAEVFQ